MRREFFISRESARLERYVKLARSGLQVDHLHSFEEVRVRRERKAIGLRARTDTSVQIPKRSRQSLEIGTLTPRGDVGVVCHERRAIEICREATDQHVFDV